MHALPPSLRLKHALEVPVLELPDGRVIAQTAAIRSFVAKVGGLDLADPYLQAKVDELCCHIEEARMQIPLALAAAKPKNDDERRVAKAGVVGENGKLLPYLAKWEDLVATRKQTYLFTADKPTQADIYLYSTINNFNCGFHDGIPAGFVSAKYPNLRQFRSQIALVIVFSPPPPCCFVHSDTQAKQSCLG